MSLFLFGFCAAFGAVNLLLAGAPGVPSDPIQPTVRWVRVAVGSICLVGMGAAIIFQHEGF